MAGQTYWGNAGGSTNSEIVRFKVEKELFYKMTWKTIVGKLNGGREVQTTERRFEGGLQKVDLGNSSLIQEKTISEGNEFRLTMMESLDGDAQYGDEPVASGDYSQYKHTRGFVNQIDSPAWQLPGRCSLKQAAELLSNPKSDLLNQIATWVAQEVDFEWIRSALMGASRGLLRTDKGGLGVTLPGATAGQFRSCYNFYVPGTGLVTPSRTRATHEANVATALNTLANSSTYHFDMAQHDKIGDLIETLNLEPPTIGGKEFQAVVVLDRALLWRMTARSGTYETLAKEARERSKDNPALNHMEHIVLDDILYVPYRWLEKFRPTVANSLPVYGPGIGSSPRNYTNTSKICLALVMGAKSFLRGRDKRVWTTTETGKHDKGVEYAAHWDDGFVRNEWDAKDGRTEMENPHMFAAAFYDAGIGTAIGS
jgi:hypothetical protein